MLRIGLRHPLEMVVALRYVLLEVSGGILLIGLQLEAELALGRIVAPQHVGTGPLVVVGSCGSEAEQLAERADARFRLPRVAFVDRRKRLRDLVHLGLKFVAAAHVVPS